jgi:hypothetical protein
MATAQTDQRRSLTLAAIFFVVAFGIFANRIIASTKMLQRSSPPLSDLESLRPYLAPLADSATARADSAATAATRDPFGATNAGATIAAPAIGAKPGTRTNERTLWVVTTILLEGSRKSAIVNDVWVNLGDSLAGGSRLTAVERDHVVVTDAKGVRHKISIQGGESW